MDGDDAADPISRARRVLRCLAAADMLCAVWFLGAFVAACIRWGPPPARPWDLGMVAIWFVASAALAVAALGLVRAVSRGLPVARWLALAIGSGVLGTTPIGVVVYVNGLPHPREGWLDMAILLTTVVPAVLALVHALAWLLNAGAVRHLGRGV